MSFALLDSLLGIVTLSRRRKQFYSMRMFEVVALPHLHSLHLQRMPARLLYTTVVRAAGNRRNTKKKLVSILLRVSCF